MGKNREVETRAAPAILAHRRRRSKEKAPAVLPPGAKFCAWRGERKTPAAQ